jgi:hypothetical protein
MAGVLGSDELAGIAAAAAQAANGISTYKTGIFVVAKVGIAGFVVIALLAVIAASVDTVLEDDLLTFLDILTSVAINSRARFISTRRLSSLPSC